MTCREKLAIEHPECVDEASYGGGCKGCPKDYGYFSDDPQEGCPAETCSECWDREIPGTPSMEEIEKTGQLMLDGFLEGVMGLEKEPEQNEIDLNKALRDLPDGDFCLNPYKSLGCKILDTMAIAEIKVEEPHILDSGWRREFASGAVRDIQEGKGRCDLLPLDVVACVCSEMLDDQYPYHVFCHIDEFQATGDVRYLYGALLTANARIFENYTTMLLEVSKHFEEGCKKYGENNWQKGIPVHCYIDSAVRHYLKFLRGDKDEPHDRAFCWNILCAIWTCKHKPELNDYRKEE